MKLYEYTGTGGVQSPGVNLCLAVCAAWSLAVFKVVGEVLDQVKAVLHLTSPAHAGMDIAVMETGFAIERIPVHRCTFFVLTCAMQLLVAGTLLVAGLQWLGSTTDIVELLLNGVALAYIMEIDELTYHVLVPTKVATLIRRMEPMDVNWPMELPLRSLLMTVPLTITLTIFMVNVLQPHAQAVSEVQQALCA